MQQKTDGELTALARSGDKQASGELLERYQAMAMRIARGMVGQEEKENHLIPGLSHRLTNSPSMTYTTYTPTRGVWVR